ncbi:MAG: cytochrome-c peroxidase [Pseudorhizobium sp.]
MKGYKMAATPRKAEKPWSPLSTMGDECSAVLASSRFFQRLWQMLIVVLIGAFPGSATGDSADTLRHSAGQALSALPPAPELDHGKVALGERLFHDPILSRRGTLSCSSCHDLASGGTIPVKRTTGYDGRMHAFNAPTIFNVGNNYRLGWRGRFTALPVQNEAVLLDRNLMSNDWQTLLPRLLQDDGYRASFKSVYGQVPGRDNVLDALVTYQRSLVTPNAAFDRFLQGDASALSPQQMQGYKLFRSFGCVSCHQGSNIGGNMFQIFGVFADPQEGASAAKAPQWAPLRIDQEGDTFRVPSLRNVEVTAPYFHDGRAATLEEAVAIMGVSQLGRQLTHSDIGAIVAFLKSLTGDYNGERLQSPSSKDRR